MSKRFGIKLREIRTGRGLSQDELAALLGTTKQVISRYENEQRTPKLDTVQDYAEKLQVPLLYLVDNELESIAELYPQKTAPSAFDVISDEPSVAFQVAGSIAAGYDRQPIFDFTDDVQIYPKASLHGRKKEDFFVLRVKGQSMEPEFQDGDCVLVQRTDVVDQNTIAVILYNGDEATLKKVRYSTNWLEMIPLNPAYPTRRMEGSELNQCRIIGKAMTISRDL